MHVTHKRACVGRNLGGTAEYLRPFLGGRFFYAFSSAKAKLEGMEHACMWNSLQNCFHGAIARMSKSEGFTNVALRKEGEQRCGLRMLAYGKRVLEGFIGQKAQTALWKKNKNRTVTVFRRIRIHCEIKIYQAIHALQK